MEMLYIDQSVELEKVKRKGVVGARYGAVMEMVGKG